MTIRQQGGVFGRNPTFNDVTVEGELIVNGEPISDFGTMALQDANAVNIDGGSIDGTAIGVAAAAAVNGTTGSFSGDLTIADKIVHAGDTDTAVRFPAADTIALETAGVRRVNVTGAGSVQIGTQTGATNKVYIFDNSAETSLFIRQDGAGAIQSWHGAAGQERAVMGPLDFKISLGNIVIGTSGKGIDFSATAGTGTSELFDDYEEGTFTATLEGSVNPATKVTTTAYYTKIGRVVQFEIAFESVDTTGYSGNVSVSGLPFTAARRTPQSILTYNSVNWTGTPVPLIPAGNTIIQVFSIDSGDLWTWATHDAGATRFISIAGSYTAA